MKLVLALVVSALAATPAHATLTASTSIDGGGVIFAIDNSVVNTCGSPVVGPCQVPDQSPALGTLTVGALALAGNLDLQVVVNTQDIASGPGFLNRLDSTGTQFTNNDTVAHTFQVAIGATDFAGPSVTASTTGAGQWSHLGGGFGGSSIAMQWFNDPENRQGGTSPGPIQPGTLIDTFADVAGAANPDSFSHNGGPFAVNDPDLFSMTLQFQGTIGPGVRLTGRELTEVKPQAVPQAGTAWLLALGAGMVGAVRLRRR